MDNPLEQAYALVKEPFELDFADTPTGEAELLAVLSDRIEEMLAKRPEYLMSLLYRLDVLERKINQVLLPGAADAPHVGLAKLVLERQKQRVQTKRNIKTDPLEDWEEWTL